MNFIKRLQTENTEKDSRIEKLEEGLRNLRAHVAGPKFQGVDADGSRRDLIAIGDVDRMVLEILADEA